MKVRELLNYLWLGAVITMTALAGFIGYELCFTDSMLGGYGTWAFITLGPAWGYLAGCLTE